MTEEKAKERIKSLEKQVRLYRGALENYRDLLNEARGEAGVLSCAIDRFTYYHPEYAEEILALIDISKGDLEKD